MEASMSDRSRIATAFAFGISAAVFTLALPVEAQVPATAPVVKPADTVSLTMEQRHIIKEIIVKDLKIAEPRDHPLVHSASADAGRGFGQGSADQVALLYRQGRQGDHRRSEGQQGRGID
jgi:hypothetical protein